MVKTPRTGHSKPEREPVTIELGPDEVSRVAAESEAEPTEAEPSGAEPGADAVKEDVGASEATAEPSDETRSGAPVDEAPPEEATPEPNTAYADEPKPAESQATGDEEQPRPSAGPEPHVASSPPRPSRGPALAAGLAGGLIALVGGGLLQLAGMLGTPGGSAVPPSMETEIAALKSEIEGLKAEAGNTGEVSGRVDGLSQALDQVRSDVASLRQTVEAGGGIAELETKIAEIETRIAAIGPGPEGPTREEIAAINDKIAGVEAQAKAAGEAGSALDSRLSTLEQSLAALSGKVDSQAQQPKIALAIAASALKAAIERGSPFGPELQTLAAVAPQAPGLAELRAHAEKGIATRSDILLETDAAAEAMIAAASPPSENDDFFERLLSSAESLVTVRPIGAVEGPGVPETVARMEVALQAGDLAKAIAEYDTLSEPAKTAGAAFADKVRARLTVEQLADQAIASAMQAP
jgi:hypothetical protein